MHIAVQALSDLDTVYTAKMICTEHSKKISDIIVFVIFDLSLYIKAIIKIDSSVLIYFDL